SAQLTDAHVRIPVADYQRWTSSLPDELMDAVTEAWGPAPGKLFVNDTDEIVLATITAGNVVLLIQPPRGFGENPVAIYHDPDLGLDERPDDEEFDDFILHVDGWLCEIKDAQIRDGLHVLGQAPAGEARVNLVLAILRASQVWGGQSAAVPGLRAALGLKENA